MEAFFNLGQHINAHLGRYSLAAMLSGVFLGSTGDYPWLQRLIPVALFLMLYPAMLDVQIDKIKDAVTKPVLLALALAINFGVAPLAIFGLAHAFKLEAFSSVMVGITLFGMVPCGGMVPAYTGMLGGNVSLSVAITATSLVLSVGMIPLWTNVLLGKYVHVSLPWMVTYLMMIVALPVVAANGTRTWFMKKKGPAHYRLIKDRLKALTGYGLMGLFVIIFTLKGKVLIHEPLVILRVMLPVASFLGVLLLTAHLLGRLAGSPYEDGVALIISSTAKNTAVAVALGATAFGPEVALVIGVSGPLVQLPIMLGFVKFKMTGKPATYLHP